MSLDFIGNDPADYGQLAAYDDAGTLLLSLQTGPLSAGDVETLSIANVGNIGYIVAGGALADTVCLDHMTFIPIPEPASLFLLLAGIALQLRRRG